MPKQIKCIFCILKAVCNEIGSYADRPLRGHQHTIFLSVNLPRPSQCLVLSLSGSAICFGQHTKSSWVPHSQTPIYHIHRECYIKHQMMTY